MAKQKVKLPSTAVGRRRLSKLAGLLEADAKNKKGIKFDLRLWGTTKVVESEFAKPEQIPIDCQTTACAVGLACISGAFKSGGLTYEAVPRTSSGNNFIPTYGELMGADAVEEFFGLGTHEFTFLFVDDSYGHTRGARGERAVAKRIRDFVAGKVAP